MNFGSVFVVIRCSLWYKNTRLLTWLFSKTYYLANFYRKLHENEEILGREASLTSPRFATRQPSQTNYQPVRIEYSSVRVLKILEYSLVVEMGDCDNEQEYLLVVERWVIVMMSRNTHWLWRRWVIVKMSRNTHWLWRRWVIVMICRNTHWLWRCVIVMMSRNTHWLWRKWVIVMMRRNTHWL